MCLGLKISQLLRKSKRIFGFCIEDCCLLGVFLRSLFNVHIDVLEGSPFRTQRLGMGKAAVSQLTCHHGSSPGMSMSLLAQTISTSHLGGCTCQWTHFPICSLASFQVILYMVALYDLKMTLKITQQYCWLLCDLKNHTTILLTGFTTSVLWPTSVHFNMTVRVTWELIR